MSIHAYLPARWHEFSEYIDELITRLKVDCLPLSAGAISYFTILSLIPLLLIGVTIAPALLTTRQLDAFVSIFSPEIADALRIQILDIIDSLAARRYALRSVALLFLLWSGSQVFLTLEMAINMIWRSQKQRSYWVRRGLAVVMVLIVGTLLVGALFTTNAVAVLGRLHVPLWGLQVQDIPFYTKFLLGFLVPTLLVTAIFAVIYYLLPTRRVTVQSVAPGAIFAGVLWSVSLHLFGWYVHHFPQNYRAIYGALWGLVLLMFWSYYSAFIMLLGAEISAVYHRLLARQGDKRERAVERLGQPI